MVTATATFGGNASIRQRIAARTLFAAGLAAAAFAPASPAKSPLPLVAYACSGRTEDFRPTLERATERLADFARREALGGLAPARFAERVIVYPSKACFDAMVRSSPGWPSAQRDVPRNFLGVAQQRELHVVAWPVFHEVHPADSLDDYVKLVAHELTHLLHAAMAGDEDRMGPIWFYEGLAVAAADQYPGAPVPTGDALHDVLHSSDRGNYADYGAIVRALSRHRSLGVLVQFAPDPDFDDRVERMLTAAR